jgi:hypothetical protein
MVWGIMKKRIKRTAKKDKQKRAFKRLEKNVKRNMGKAFEGVVYNAPGEIKMSDALEEIIAPFVDDADTLVAMKNLVGMGAMVWNITLVPPDEQEEQIQKLIKTMGPEPENAEIFYRMIHEMMQRKQALYPEVHRFIVSFEVEDVGDGWHISVASTLSPQD